VISQINAVTGSNEADYFSKHHAKKIILKSDDKCEGLSFFCDKIVQSKVAAMEKSVFAL